RNRLPLRPPRRQDAPAQIDQLVLRDLDAEGADRVAVRSCLGLRAAEDTDRRHGCEAKRADGRNAGKDAAPGVRWRFLGHDHSPWAETTAQYAEALRTGPFSYWDGTVISRYEALAR